MLMRWLWLLSRGLFELFGLIVVLVCMMLWIGVWLRFLILCLRVEMMLVVSV